MGVGMIRFTSGLAALMLVVLASGAQAATLDFTGAGPQGGGFYTEDGLQFDDVRIVNGNCDALSGKSCGALNDNETSVLTAVGGGTFSLTSFWFQLLGRGTDNTLFVITDLLATAYEFPRSIFGNNDGGQYVDLTLLTGFAGATSVTFYTEDGGNVRIDDLAIAAVVPVPAAGFLLVGALGGLAALRRRRKLV